MIQGIGGEWKGEDLDAAGRLYQLRFCPEADQGLRCGAASEHHQGCEGTAGHRVSIEHIGNGHVEGANHSGDNALRARHRAESG